MRNRPVFRRLYSGWRPSDIRLIIVADQGGNAERGCLMKRLIAFNLVALALAIGAAGAQAPNVQEKQIVALIKANWIAFRHYSGRQFIYFSNLLAYRCGLTKTPYPVISYALDRVFPLPPCDPAQPLALDAVKYP